MGGDPWIEVISSNAPQDTGPRLNAEYAAHEPVRDRSHHSYDFMPSSSNSSPRDFTTPAAPSGTTGAGGANERFPSTRWSRLLAPGEEESARRRAWESLASTYWKPVYAYVRARWARSDDDALDCTQEFFVHLLESDLVERADPVRGRFRAYMKTSLANFVRDLERKRRSLKRGGERTLLSLAGDRTDPTALELPDPTGMTPEDALDDAWRAEVMEGATLALEEELASQGKSIYFTVFQEYFLSDTELDYRTVAEQHDLKASDVSNYLQHAKRRFRSVLRAVVADTVGDRGDLETELAWLFGRGGA